MVEGRGQLDHQAVDWPRVACATYQVRQHYRYTYTGPVTNIAQRLVMIPPDRHGDQRLLTHRLEVRGTGGRHTLVRERDAFGNRICWVGAGRVEAAIDFEARYRVKRFARGVRPLFAGDVWKLRDYLKHTGLTAPDDRLRAVARELSDGVSSPRVLAERAHDWASGAIAYQLGVTGVQTPAAMALHLGRGVCQDYAHLLLCVLRLLKIPARYVSGHLLGEGAPHAWVEAFTEGGAATGGDEIVAYDPTHHRRAGLNYITVAVGRDFADITPTSGVFSGAASGTLSSSKHAEILEIEYTDGEESAA